MSRQHGTAGRAGRFPRPAVWVAAAIVVAAGLLARVFALGGQEPVEPRAGAGALPVATITVRYQDSYTETVAFTGRVRAPAVSRLGFEQPGRIVAIPVREGDRFAEGDVLARLDDARLKAEERRIRAALAEAEANRDLAAETAERVRALFKAGHVSRQRLDEAEAQFKVAEAAVAGAKADLARIRVALAQTRIVAPFAGVVTARLVDEGTVIAAGTPVLAVVASDGAGELLVGLPEADARDLEPGRDYPVRLEDGREITARLAGLVPQLEPGSRALIARLALPAGIAVADGALGSMLVERRVPLRGFWLPLDALTADLRGLWRVYALDEDPERGWPHARVHFENVQILHAAGDRAYVTGTVPDGTRVIATGLHRVVPGMLVRAEEAGGEDPAAQAHALHPPGKRLAE